MELSHLYNILRILFTPWSYSQSGVDIGCKSPHCKERQTLHSIHSQLSYIMECREANVLYDVPVNCVT